MSNTIGIETLSVSATVIGLTVPIGAKSAEISIEQGATGIRYSTGDEGTAVTATTNGTALGTGTLGRIEGLAELKAFRAISQDGTPHTLQITYFS